MTAVRVGAGAVGAGRVRRIGDPTLVIALAIATWAVVTAVGDFHSAVLPSPARVYSVLSARWLSLLGSMAETFAAVLRGFAIGAAFGVIGAVLLYRLSWFRRAFYPYLVASFVVPKPVVIPLLLIWVGVNPTYQTIVVVLFALFPVLENTLAGLRDIDGSLLELSEVLRMPPSQTTWRIRLPAALPMISAGLRIGLAEAFVGAIVAETLAPRTGIGSRIMEAAMVSNTPLILAALVVIAAVGLAMYIGVEFLERRALHWQLQGARTQA